MSAECERLRGLAAELALGIADGEDRAWALDHLAGCPSCRARVERLAAVADELPLLAAAVEPPPGFEARAAEAMRPTRAPVRHTRRIALTLAAAFGAAALAAGVVWLALADDRELADSYRETLAVANGEYFTASALELPGGERAGYVYGYQGRTSWVLAVIYDGVDAGRYRLAGVTAGGERLPVGELEVAGGRGSAGSAIPVDYDELAELRLLDQRGREIAESRLGD